ncbi:MAG: 2-amino-4-oxopentanoate thiolase subunit OrtA [Bacteroidota bacterium]
MQEIPAGTWVTIERIVLAPGHRAPGLPPETASVPLTAMVKGFLVAPAALAGSARVRTAAGREVEGILREANPPYRHGFGELVPEIMTVGEEARKRLGE